MKVDYSITKGKGVNAGRSHSRYGSVVQRGHSMKKRQRSIAQGAHDQKNHSVPLFLTSLNSFSKRLCHPDIVARRQGQQPSFDISGQR